MGKLTDSMKKKTEGIQSQRQRFHESFSEMERLGKEQQAILNRIQDGIENARECAKKAEENGRKAAELLSDD